MSTGSVAGHAILGGAGTSSISGAAVIKGRVVLVGGGAESPSGRAWPTVWVSPDGGGWQRRDAGALGLVNAGLEEAGVVMRGVAGDDRGRLVAVGYANFEPATDPLVWRSTDQGDTWDLVTAPSTSRFASIESVTWWRDRFVAVGEDDGRPATWVSPDGSSWVQVRTANVEGRLEVVVGHDDRVVAASSDGSASELWYAGDDLVWHRAALPVEGSISDMDSDGQRLIAVGSTEPNGADADIVLLTSATGDTWEVHPGATAAATPAEEHAFGVGLHDGALRVGGRVNGHAALWEGSVGGGTGTWSLGRVAARVFDVDAAVTLFAATSEHILAFGYRDGPRGEQAVLWSRAASVTELDLPGWVDLGPLHPPRVEPVIADTAAGLLLWGGERDPSRDDQVAWSGLLVDPATGWSRVIGMPDVCRSSESAAVWTGQGLVVWDARSEQSESCHAAAHLDPLTGTWTAIDSTFFARVGDAPVLSTDGELLAWTEGLGFDLGAGTTREFPPIPDFDADAARPMFSPATAHWTGDRIVVLDHAAPRIFDPATQTWSTGPLPPVGGRARASIWTGEEVLAVNYNMEAATFDPSTNRWTKQDPLPLRFSECVPQVARGAEVTVAGLCTGVALWDDSARWALMSRPQQGRLTTAAGHVFEVGRRLLRIPFPTLGDAGLEHPRHFPVGVLQFSLPDGWEVAARHHDDDLGPRPRTRIHIPLDGPDGQRCAVAADHPMDPVAPEGRPTDLVWQHEGQPLDVFEDTSGPVARITVTSPERSTDLTQVVCDDLADARTVAAHLWLPSRG